MAKGLTNKFLHSTRNDMETKSFKEGQQNQKKILFKKNCFLPRNCSRSTSFLCACWQGFSKSYLVLIFVIPAIRIFGSLSCKSQTYLYRQQSAPSPYTGRHSGRKYPGSRSWQSQTYPLQTTVSPLPHILAGMVAESILGHVAGNHRLIFTDNSLPPPILAGMVAGSIMIHVAGNHRLIFTDTAVSTLPLYWQA
jgi:hypothetical protein